MSGSRGRKVTSGRSGDPRWPNQQPYYNQNASIPDLRSGWDNWNIPPPSSGYGWQPNSNLHQVWPSPHYRGGGYYTEDHIPRSGDFDQFQHRFPNSFTPPSHFSERSLAHLNQTPLNELSSSGHSGFRDGSSTRDPSSSKQPNSAKDKQNPQSVRSKTADKTSAARNRVPSNPSNNEISSAATTQDSVGGVEKPNVPVKSTSFMPPNNDLMNKVKASLKSINATKDQAPVRSTSSPAEPPVPSSPQRVRESRVPTTEPSPSARHPIRVAAGSHRRTSQSSSTSNSGANGETQNNPLEGLGFIQNSSNSENLDSVSQANRIRNSSGGSSTHESEPLTTIPKERLNKYIRSMDNQQRRQLVEQPRSIISQYMLNHLVQENQTAKARQLSSLRFRVSSNELESRTENTVVLSEELVDEFKELLSRNDEETAKQPDSEEEEIQVLEPPPKVPPLCIDLDLDDKPASPTPSSSPDANSSLPVKPTERGSISDRNDNTADFVERELDSQLSAASIPAASSTPDAARVPEALLTNPTPEVPRIPEALLLPTPVAEATTTSQVPCPVPLSHNTSIPTMTVTLQPSPPKEPSTASTSTVPSIITTVSAGKKSFLEKSKGHRKKERREKQANEQSTEREKGKAKKQKKKDRKKSPTKPRKEKTRLETDSTSTQNASNKKAEVVDLDNSDNATSAVDRAGTSNQFADSAGGKSALNFLLTDLQIEEQQGKDRIALIDRTIEELQLERKALTDKVLALKQQQFDLLRSAMSSSSFGNDTVPRPLESVPAPVETPVTMESADQKDEEIPEVASEEASPVQPVPPAASTQLLSLMHQLEENGVQVALGDMEAVPSDSVTPTSIGTKRKRIPSDDSKQQKKKGTPTNSPLRSTADIPPVEKPGQVQTNEAVAQPMQFTPALPQTLSISQINQITSTISSVIAQSVETISCTKKTPTPVILPNQSKKATSPSESSLAAESHNQSKEIPAAKSQSVSSSPKVPEPKVPDPKPAEPKAVEPKAVEPKKSATVAEKAKVVTPKNVVNASKTTEKSAEVTTSRPNENVRTYSKRDEASSKNTTPKPCPPVNPQVSGAAGRLSARTTEPSQGKDAAATATPSVSTQKSTSSSTTAKQTTPATTTTAPRTNSSNPILLRSHESSVRCVYICGPCAFTASEDGTVHIYDLNTNALAMRILGHTKPVTWLYGVALNTSGEVMKSIKSTTDYLNHLTLITGSEDAHIRQFALDSGSLIHERFCKHALTCAVGHKFITKLYVGTTEGTIFTYNPKINSIRINKFKANGEVICMKILNVRGKRAIIVAARRMDPVVYDLDTEDALFTLTSNIPSSSFYCMSSTSHFVFCCDANKNLFKFDTNSDNMYITETLPSAAVSSSFEGNRYLILGCMDGVIRVIDTLHKPSRIITLPGQALKTITCMKIVNGKMVGGSLNGEVAYCQLPNLEALCKVNG